MNTESLKEKAEMLGYVTIHVDQKKEFASAPVLLDQNTTSMDLVPVFVLSSQWCDNYAHFVIKSIDETWLAI